MGTALRPRGPKRGYKRGSSSTDKWLWKMVNGEVEEPEKFPLSATQTVIVNLCRGSKYRLFFF